MGVGSAADDRSRFGPGGRDEVAYFIETSEPVDSSPWWMVHRLGRGLSGLCTGFGVITAAAMVGSFGGLGLGMATFVALLSTVWLTPALGRRLDAGGQSG